jgi:hypothetical protein
MNRHCFVKQIRCENQDKCVGERRYYVLFLMSFTKINATGSMKYQILNTSPNWLVNTVHKQRIDRWKSDFLEAVAQALNGPKPTKPSYLLKLAYTQHLYKNYSAFSTRR